MKARVVDVPGGPLTIFESDDVERDLDAAIAAGAPAPYGRVLWSSAACVARVLARVLAERGTRARVVELGCGTGLASLCAARAGASVLATDVDAGALAFVQRGAEQAGLHVDTALFDVAGAAPLPAADIVVAADLAYEPMLAAALARRLIEARRAGATVVVGDPGRVSRVQLERLLREADITVAFERVDADGGSSDVAVL